MKLDTLFLREALRSEFVFIDGKEKIPDCDHDYSVSIDTRTLESGQIFVALEGSLVNGHDFLQDAVAKGAAALIIQKNEAHRIDSLHSSCPIIIVPDTFDALVSLARAWRARFSYPVVGITGSVGKTTTKEMVRTILDRAGVSACVSYKNQNTLVGLCLNILRMRYDHEAAVFEVGISQKGEMATKIDVLRPTIGVITTVAHAHMDGLGSLVEIAQEKKKLFSHFTFDDIGIVCGDNKLLTCAPYEHPVIRFGMSTKNHVQARQIKHIASQGDGPPLITRFALKFYREKRHAYLKTNHMGNVYNSLAAATVAHLLGVDLSTVCDGLASFGGFEERFERRVLKKGRGVLISDCYNASPESMRAALLAIDEIETAGKKIAILGDMLELGEKESFWHRQIGRVLNRTSTVNSVILVGKRARAIGETVHMHTDVSYADDWEQAVRVLEDKACAKDSLILVKASHAMELDRLVETVCE